jgi:peptidyl-prolyl cis-trans isomerase C
MYRIVLSIMFVAVGSLLIAGCSDQLDFDNEPPMEARIARGADPLAAEVNGSPIYLSDVRREAIAQGLLTEGEQLTIGSVEFTQVLEELIDHRLLALEAIHRELHENEEARRRVASARERILGNVLVESVVDRALTDEAVRRMYDEQVSLVELGDEVRARHIVTADRASAERVLRQARNGADFAALAEANSIDELTSTNGGDLGYFTPDMVTASMAREVFAADIGDIVGPVETELGWHILSIEDRRPEERPSFEELRPRLVQFMTFDEIQRLIDMLRARAQVRRYAQADTAPIIGQTPPALRGATDIVSGEPLEPAEEGIEEGGEGDR